MQISVKFFDKNIADNVDALIKIFDRLHNLQTIRTKSPEKVLKTVRETIKSFMLIAVYLEIRKIEQQLLNACINFIEQNFLSEIKHNDIFKTMNFQNSSLSN